MTDLLTLIEEATRSGTESVQYFVEPAEDALRRATSRRHHIVFGRRGSGKSSLLRKAGEVLTRERRPKAWVDLESFKGLTNQSRKGIASYCCFEYTAWMSTNDTRRLSPDAQEALRMRVMRAVRGGMRKSVAARTFGVSRTSIDRWLSIVELGNLTSLKSKPRGRPKARNSRRIRPRRRCV